MEGSMSFVKMVMMIFVLMVILAMLEGASASTPICCGWNPDCCQASLQEGLPRQMKFIPSNT